MTRGALLVAAGLLLPGRLAAQAGPPLSATTLDNGLDVVVIEDHAVPLVTVELDVRNGAYTESPEYDGLSHLYEHMFFKANRAIPSQEKYLERLNELGASWNGSTSTERVNYFVTVGVDSLEPAMVFMENAIRFPLFERGELERERQVVLGEFDRNEADPGFHLARAVDSLLWSPGYYSRKNPIGDREVIASTTPEKMRTIQRRFYVPNNTALILAGDVTPERGFALAREVFGDWPRSDDPFATPVPDPPPLAGSVATLVERPVNTVTVQVAWQGPSVGSDPTDTFVADLLSTALANPASPFQKALVDTGLAFDAGISYYTQAHVGPITVTAHTTPDKAVALRRAITAEIGKLAAPDYLSADELEAAKTQFRIDRLYALERASAAAHDAGFYWAVAGLDYYRGYEAGVEAVTRDDVARFARRWLVGKPNVTGVLVAPDAAGKAGLKASDFTPGEESR